MFAAGYRATTVKVLARFDIHFHPYPDRLAPMAISDSNAFRVTLRKSDDRPIIEAIQQRLKKSEGVDVSDAGVVRRALVELKKKLDKEAKKE